MTDVFYSILIPARNAGRTLDICLASLSNMAFPKGRYEVIVIDDGSTDDTADVAEAQGARLIRRRCASIAEARNAAAGEATGNVLVHLDADMEVDPGWLAMADEYYGRGYEGALHFDDEAPRNAGPVARIWYGAARIKRRVPRRVDFLPTRNLFVNRSIHDELKGFDEALFAGGRGGSDKEFTYRLFKAGYPLTSDPRLRMIHHGCERSLLEFMKKEWWRQGNTLHVAKQHGYALRLMKNPLFSALHLALMLAFAEILLFAPRLSGPALVCWMLPTVLILLKRMDLTSSPLALLQAALLTFARWNVAALSLVAQMLRGIRP